MSENNTLRRLILGAFAASTLGAPAMAQPAARPAQAPAAAALTAPMPPDPSAVAQRAFPDDVVGLMDITYSRITGFRPLRLDIYTTRAKTTALKPLVIWLHGGGWNTGDQRGGAISTPAYRNWPNWLAVVASRGYVVAGVSYRFSSEAKYPAQIEDVKAAVRWLRANAATYGIDPNRVIVWGASAGAQLAAVLGTSCGVAELEGPIAKGAEGSSCVQGVVDFYGPIDFTVETPRPAGAPPRDPRTSGGSQYLGCVVQSCPPEQLRRSNAISYIDKSDPPFLIIHGDADTLVAPKQSQLFYDALQKGGVKSELVWIPGVNHIFQGGTDAQGKQIFDKVMAFLDATTGVRPAK